MAVVGNAGGDNVRVRRGLSVALTLPASLPLPLTATRAVPLPVLVLRVLPLLGVATLAALALAEAVIAVPVPVGSLHANDGGCAPRRQQRRVAGALWVTRFVVVGRWAGCGDDRSIGSFRRGRRPAEAFIPQVDCSCSQAEALTPDAGPFQPANPPRCDATRLRLL